MNAPRGKKNGETSSFLEKKTDVFGLKSILTHVKNMIRMEPLCFIFHVISLRRARSPTDCESSGPYTSVRSNLRSGHLRVLLKEK